MKTRIWIFEFTENHLRRRLSYWHTSTYLELEAGNNVVCMLFIIAFQYIYTQSTWSLTFDYPQYQLIDGGFVKPHMFDEDINVYNIGRFYSMNDCFYEIVRDSGIHHLAIAIYYTDFV